MTGVCLGSTGTLSGTGWKTFGARHIVARATIGRLIVVGPVAAVATVVGVQSLVGGVPSRQLVVAVAASPAVPALASAAFRWITHAFALPVNDRALLPAVRRDATSGSRGLAVGFLGRLDAGEFDVAAIRPAYAQAFTFTPGLTALVARVRRAVRDIGVRCRAEADTILRVWAIHQTGAFAGTALFRRRPRLIVDSTYAATLLHSVSSEALPGSIIRARVGTVAVATFPVGGTRARSSRIVVA